MVKRGIACDAYYHFLRKQIFEVLVEHFLARDVADKKNPQ